MLDLGVDKLKAIIMSDSKFLSGKARRIAGFHTLKEAWVGVVEDKVSAIRLFPFGHFQHLLVDCNERVSWTDPRLLLLWAHAVHKS